MPLDPVVVQISDQCCTEYAASGNLNACHALAVREVQRPVHDTVQVLQGGQRGRDSISRARENTLVLSETPRSFFLIPVQGSAQAVMRSMTGPSRPEGCNASVFFQSRQVVNVCRPVGARFAFLQPTWAMP